jgi:hypothetical protein
MKRPSGDRPRSLSPGLPAGGWVRSVVPAGGQVEPDDAVAGVLAWPVDEEQRLARPGPDHLGAFVGGAARHLARRAVAHRTDDDAARLARLDHDIGQPRAVRRPAGGDVIAGLVSQPHWLTAGQVAQIDLPGQHICAAGIGDGLAVGRDGSVPLHGLGRGQQLGALDRPRPRVHGMPGQPGAHDRQQAGGDPQRRGQPGPARAGTQQNDIGSGPLQPIADPRHGIDREAVVEGLR